MDFDEIFDSFFDSLSDVIHNIPSDEVTLDSVHDNIQTLFDNLSCSGIELTDEQNDLIISKLSETLSEPQDSVRDAIDAINNNGMNTVDNLDNNISEVNEHKWDGEFCGICWEECLSSPTHDASKRMTCGYYG